MKIVTQSDSLITHAYKEYYRSILYYITYRITRRWEAEDLTQDVFVRLLDYRQILRPDTVKNFLFTISRNMVIDYLRREYKKQEIDGDLSDATTITSNETEEMILVNDLLIVEQTKLDTFPEQRKLIYFLNRFEEKSIAEIADELSLNKRTVENHLRIGRKVMRDYLRVCI